MHTEVRRRRPPRIFAAILLLLGLALLAGGARLISLGGSFYYAFAGLALIASAVLLWRGDRRGSWLYGLFLAATLLWSLFEVGVDLWALAPRVLALAVIGLWFLTPWVRRGLYSPGDPPPLLRSRTGASAAAVIAIVAVTIVTLGARNPADATPALMGHNCY